MMENTALLDSPANASCGSTKPSQGSASMTHSATTSTRSHSLDEEQDGDAKDGKCEDDLGAHGGVTGFESWGFNSNVPKISYVIMGRSSPETRS